MCITQTRSTTDASSVEWIFNVCERSRDATGVICDISKVFVYDDSSVRELCNRRDLTALNRI